MAIKPDTSLPAFTNAGGQIALYTPGQTTFSGVGACGVCPGDILVVKTVQFTKPDITSDITPDLAGYLPHLAYYPAVNQLADPRSVDSQGNRKGVSGACYSNDDFPPVLRFNLRGALVCRYRGDIVVEGGTGPGGTAGQISISYLWARSWAHRDDGLYGLTQPGPPITQRLTMYDAGGIDGNGNPIPVAVPYGAARVFTASAQAITLNFSPTSYSTTFRATSEQPLDIGPFFFVTTPLKDAIFFEIDY